MKLLDRKTETPQKRLSYSTDGLAAMLHLLSLGIHLNNDFRRKVYALTVEAAHAAFDIFPELREEGSLPRYFVAKEARMRGLRGAAVTEFVEREYQAGTWWKLVPEEVLKGEAKVA